jgi:hypothetical protein
LAKSLTAPDEGAEEHRREHRRRVLLAGRLVHGPNELTVDCAIQDLSRKGARLKLPPAMMLQEPIYLINFSHGLAFQARVTWRQEARIGLAFIKYFDLSKPIAETPKLLRRLWLDHIRTG